MRGALVGAVLLLLSACAARPDMPASSPTPSPKGEAAQPALETKEARRQTADAPFRASPPPLGPLPAPATSAVQTLRLSNGLRVMFVEEHVPALLRVELVLKARPAPPGANLMAASDLWMEEDVHTDTARIARRDAQRAQSWSWASRTAMGAGISGLSLHAADIIDLLAEVALHPTFPAGSVLRANSQRMLSRQREDDSPGTLAARALPMTLYGWTRPEDTEESLRASDFGALVRDDVAHAWDAASDPASATLVVVGDTTTAALRPLLERAFGHWKKRTSVKPVKVEPPAPSTATPRIVVIDRPHSAASHVLLGGEGPAFRSADWDAALVMNLIFGGGTGRVTHALRDRDQLVFRSSSYLAGTVDAPRLTWQGELPTEKTAEGLRELDHQIQLLRQTDASSSEVEEARERLARVAPSWKREDGEETHELNVLIEHGLPPVDEAAERDRLVAITANDVRRMAVRYLDPARMKLVIVGDLARIRPQLESLGWGPIEVRSADGAILEGGKSDPPADATR